MTYEVVIFDFDGVLCHDRFYANLKESYPEVHAFIDTKVFGGVSDIPDRWMRNELTSEDVNRLISDHTGIDLNLLSKMFVESVIQMRVDDRLTDLALKLSQQGVSTALVTCNMDIFNRVTVRNHNLDRVFPVIINSCDFGCLKHEQDGRLFDIAMQQLGQATNYGRSLLIDDSGRARATFKSKGGDTFAYSTYELFKPWAEENLILPLQGRDGRGGL